MLVRTANRKDPDQTAALLQKQSDLVLSCLFWPFGRQLVFEIFKVFTVQWSI